MTHKVTISRGAESTAPAARKHFQELLSRYSNVHIVNLLSQKDTSGEYPLSEAYRQCVARMSDIASQLSITCFDFHAIVKRDNYERVGVIFFLPGRGENRPDKILTSAPSKLSELISQIALPLDDQSHLLLDGQSGNIILTQSGIMRTNCLDCLDRTNVVQTSIARFVLERQLEAWGLVPSAFEKDNFLNAYNNLWADNGDWLSKIYAGTGALKSSYTRKGKQTVFGFLDDAAKSVNRFYINNFQDKGRQEAIDLLLGKFSNRDSILLRNPLHEAVAKDMEARLSEYSSTSRITMFLGTYNVNGKLHKGESLDSWLRTNKATSPQLYAIGIQELIELTAGQYISTDTDKLRLFWEGTLMRAINAQGGGSYVLVRSLHLVALGLFIFVRADCVTMLRKVESSTKKTGLGGMAANKGGIGISLNVNDTTIALVTAHLAAGSKAVYDRNDDYRTISEGLNFRGMRLMDHE
ncbi:Endonuclease/exonuclease/phosphatase [Blyttiomyces helicus]|uniref:phosphoinositide 5-phosphatase n=1 Tax=Blyttiomyces helicus TaxID=388810 RepID=A0A4P9WBJ8_9FUNG|nr:Endonuclease/exonuclease/phosphatase [Blyttiomyces helicus]|eukprot:RKO88290.1 Endonuclease/exonuclease/phosphatase [Blyttiomyces helicus]